MGPGPYEHRLSAWVRTRFGPLDHLAADSGTTALSLAIRTALEERDGPVALPAYSCYDVATAAIGAGARVALYDVSPETLGPDLDSLRSVIRDGATAIVVAHLYGLPVDLSPVRELARESDAAVIEDAAQGIGGAFRGRPLGTLGDVGVLSFGRGKGLTGGAGGLLLANNELGRRLLERARPVPGAGRRGWADLARATATWILGRPELYRVPTAIPLLRLGDTVYRRPHVPRLGTAAMHGVLSRTTMSVEAEAETRRRHAGRLLAALSAAEAPLRPFPVPTGATPGYLRLPLLSRESGVRDLARDAGRDLGVMPGYPMPLSRLPPLRDALTPSSHGDVPGARALAERLLTLPTHGRLTEGDCRRLEAWLRERAPAF